MNYGKNLKRFRMAANMTQVQLAERVGVSESMIYQLERGTKNLTMQLGVEIAEVLGITINDLIGASEGGA